jgi:hypothetical protein
MTRNLTLINIFPVKNETENLILGQWKRVILRSSSIYEPRTCIHTVRRRDTSHLQCHGFAGGFASSSLLEWDWFPLAEKAEYPR